VGWKIRIYRCAYPTTKSIETFADEIANVYQFYELSGFSPVCRYIIIVNGRIIITTSILRITAGTSD